MIERTFPPLNIWWVRTQKFSSKLQAECSFTHPTNLNPIFAERVHNATMHMAQYVDLDTAHYMALNQMHFALLEQSTLWAFIDTFRIFALASFIIIPLLLLMREVVNKQN